jgi:hypothetical protein
MTEGIIPDPLPTVAEIQEKGQEVQTAEDLGNLDLARDLRNEFLLMVLLFLGGQR